MMKKILTLLILVLGLASAASSPAAGKFKLKPGAKGRICLTCHAGFDGKLKKGHVHGPVKSGECSDCHNPHASAQKRLLADEGAKLCTRCHSVVPAKAVSVHRVIAEGKCLACHDPHASDNRYILHQRGNKLCYSCHDGMEAAVVKAKFRHSPVEKDCLSCHRAHASEKSRHLLKEPVPALCVQCHKTSSGLFIKQHMNYPVAGSSCTGCHSAHGSGRGGILHDTVHKPVASKMCNQCHEEAGAASPFRTKRSGNDLCRSCHSNMMNEMLLKNRIHWPVLSKKGCLSCHNPHTSKETGLRTAPMKELCGNCHQDTMERSKQAVKKHAPVQEGNCTACHQPHVSDSTFLLNQPLVELCQGCHDWKKHQTHPMGEKVRDRRNKNLAVACLSCHDAHGTDFKSLTLHSTISEMCTQCHTEYRR